MGINASGQGDQPFCIYYILCCGFQVRFNCYDDAILDANVGGLNPVVMNDCGPLDECIKL